MMQPRHWLDRQHALNSSGLRELTGRRAPELADQAYSNFEKSTSDRADANCVSA
jgi:hypothetical protein